MKNFIVSLSILGATLFASAQALAWADLGHSIVGAVAEENLKPSTRDFVRGVLGVEPLGTAAVWADHVRDDDRFGHKDDATTAGAANTHNFSDYHFCEIPVGFNYGNRPVKVQKDCHGAILGAIALLKDVKGKHSKAEQMIALRYLAHVMGDITQPLHVGNGYDMGGNVCQIKFQKYANGNPSQMNLHSFWDDALVVYLGSTYADPATGKKGALYMGQFLTELKARHADMFTAAAKKTYSAGTLEDWLMESATLRETIYPDDAAVMSQVKKGEEYKNRPYCLWFEDQAKGKLADGVTIDPAKIPVIDTAFADRFTGTVEMQLLKGGLRLAQALDDIADTVAKSKHSTDKIDQAQQEKVLSNVTKAFLNP